MTIFNRFILLACLLAMATVTANAQKVEPATVDPALAFDPQLRHTLLHPDTPDAQRAAALQEFVALGQAGNAVASYQLGALYRSGPAHPANATPRDLDTARHWFELCIQQSACPRVTLLSLAELELSAMRPQQAMQWAQGAIAAQRAANRHFEEKGVSDWGSTAQAYESTLLARIQRALPRAERSDTAINAQLQAWLEIHRDDLIRMITDEATLYAAAQGEFFGPRYAAGSGKGSVPVGPVPGQALFMVRAVPAGGRPDEVVLIDALPTPRDAKPLFPVARGQRFEPFQPRAGESHRFLTIPITFEDERFKLKSTQG